MTRRAASRYKPPTATPAELRLLLAEVSQYLDQVRAALADPGPEDDDELHYKSAYIATLSLAFRNQNFSQGEHLSEAVRRHYHGLAFVSLLLHRVTLLARSVFRQSLHLSRPDFINDYALDEFFDEIDLGLSLIRPALEQRREKQITRLCLVEERLDALYTDRFRRLSEELGAGRGRPGDLVTTLMIIHYLERIGDIILEIGEELIHIFIGERLRFAQYQSLTDGLKTAGLDPGRAVAFQSIWSGRSGCRVGVVGAGRGRAASSQVVFKCGPAGKMERERDNLKLWSALAPGLTPAVRAFVPAQEGREAALILEYVSGRSLRDLFLERVEAAAETALLGALEIMAELWRTTRQETPARASFAKQAEKRLGPVRALYSDLVNFKGFLGEMSLKSLREILGEAIALEQDLFAPFTVRIHGDFNLTNIICEEGGTFRFLDLYRSRTSDYAQDISVMILSLLRLPKTGAADRERLSRAAGLVWDFAMNFAFENQDQTLQARLAFGLARSYLTSARFEPRRPNAARFIGYGRRLLETLLAHGRGNSPWPEYRLDRRALYI
ncbi:MAG: phosphotransferase [Deltaproteobacteria bacterium]|nr:phosphotransferase [Deltaproteobacteria bacterium]